MQPKPHYHLVIVRNLLELVIFTKANYLRLLVDARYYFQKGHQSKISNSLHFLGSFDQMVLSLKGVFTWGQLPNKQKAIANVFVHIAIIP